MKNLKYYRREFKAMGTLCDIQLFARDEAKAKHVADAAIADAQRLEALYSRYKADSFLSEINRVAAIGGSIGVDGETACLLDYAVTCYEQSGGMFDITSEILCRAWKFDQGKSPVTGSANVNPNSDGLVAELNYLPWSNVKLAARYTAYGKFNGARYNYDGFGRNVSDNNSIFLLAWLLF